MISVVHTFGRDLKYNPHIHALVPEIKIRGQELGKLNYFNYQSLRKIWQYKLISYMMKKKPHKKKEYSSYYKRYPKGFYVYAEGKMKNAKKSAQYIGRYLARPAMAEQRIIDISENQITYWYIDHHSKKREEVQESIESFMGKLIMHIPAKYQKLVRRYGIYAGRTPRPLGTGATCP
ncbi:IS91 family transposase [Tindallia californiensis]|uniref:Putative transposase n=1 Tax=Tindallia californiensis TaxID=159292 RepID=A0A1H3R9J5_9FIRM|nr:transposase [Tindallia californiensis]SDZ22502.1 Putative transposase [Tindallia californiensis]